MSFSEIIFCSVCLRLSIYPRLSANWNSDGKKEIPDKARNIFSIWRKTDIKRRTMEIEHNNSYRHSTYFFARTTFSTLTTSMQKKSLVLHRLVAASAYDLLKVS